MYRTLRGEVEGEDVSSETVQVYFNFNNEFYLPKDFKIQVWGAYGSPFKDGLQLYSERSAVHIGVSKSFFDKI
jgi:hypothetical protein